MTRIAVSGMTIDECHTYTRVSTVWKLDY